MADRYLLESGSPDGYLLEDGSGVLLLESPALVALSDDFDDNSQDVTKWSTSQFYNLATTAGTTSETNSHVEVTPHASNVSGGNEATGYKSVSTFDVTGTAIFAKVTPSATVPTGQQAYLSFGPSNATHFQVLIDGTNLELNQWISNALTFLFTVTYDATNHAWLRLRHDSPTDTICLDAAPSSAANPPGAGDWTNLASVPRSASVALTSSFVAFGCVTYTSVASPVMVVFDGFNTATTSGTTVAPSAGHVVLAGHQPSLTKTFNIAPSAGHLTLGGKVSTVSVGTSLSPSKGSLVLTGHQPSSSLNIGISPTAGHLALGGKVPTITKNFAVSSTVGHIALGGKIPAVSINFAVSASVGRLTLGGKVPTVTKNFVIGPSLGHLSLSGKIPSITIASGLTPGTGHLSLTGKVPAVTMTVNPATGHIVFAGHASNIGLQVNAAAGRLQFGGGVPLVSANSGITPLTAHLALIGNVPTLTLGAGALGHIKVYLGSFIAKPVKVWNGSAWVVKPLKSWTGLIWRATGF